MRPQIVVGESAGVRTLHFGSRWIQGAMRLQRPWTLELEYTRAMLAPLALAPAGDWPGRVLVVGLGAASFVRWFWRHRPGTRMTVVEIDERVVAVARAQFKLPDDERIRIVVGDAADVVPALDERHDLVLVDGFDARGRSGRLESAGFQTACRARMADGGFLSINLLARTRGIAPALARLREAHGDEVRALAACASGNTVAIATRGGDWGRPRERAVAAARLRSETGLDLRSTLASLA